jgi:hypothetical protein
MPKEITHILIAKEVLRIFKASEHPLFTQTLETHLPAYYLGAIIPDAMFYDVLTIDRISANYLKLVRVLHTKDTAENNQRALRFFSAIRKTPSQWPLKVAFSAGVVTHTVSDGMVHGMIDMMITRWNKKGSVALATHRQLETLMDMVLLKQQGQSAESFPLERLTMLDGPRKDCILVFYLYHLMGGNGLFAPRLLRVLERATSEQLYFLKLFRTTRLYHIVTTLNKLVGGRLESWSSLFYPETIGPEAIPILNRPDLEPLIHKQAFAESISILVKDIASKSVSAIHDGLEGL